MPNPTVRIKIPKNPEDQITLAEKIFAKHSSDGADSPLNLLEDHNWKDNGEKIKEAKQKQAQAKQMQKDMERIYAERDALLTPIMETVKATRTLLMGKYAKSPKKLGDWSFEVDDTPKAKKLKKIA